jgi:hypothetical protein
MKKGDGFRYQNEKRYAPKPPMIRFKRKLTDVEKIERAEQQRQTVERMRGRMHY